MTKPVLDWKDVTDASPPDVINASTLHPLLPKNTVTYWVKHRGVLYSLDVVYGEDYSGLFLYMATAPKWGAVELSMGFEPSHADLLGPPLVQAWAEAQILSPLERLALVVKEKS